MRTAAFVVGAFGLAVLISPILVGAYMERKLKGPDESSSYFVVIHYPWWLLAIGISFLVLALVIFFTTPKGPIQSIQRNAGSRPSSGDSPASNTRSESAPRG